MYVTYDTLPSGGNKEINQSSSTEVLNKYNKMEQYYRKSASYIDFNSDISTIHVYFVYSKYLSFIEVTFSETIFCDYIY